MKAFITGSHAYGIPTIFSDVDLGVLVDKSVDTLLFQLAEGDSSLDPELGQENGYGGTLRFGDLNLIAFTKLWEYEAWRAATELLYHWSCYNGPVSRELAIETIKTEKKRRCQNDH